MTPFNTLPIEIQEEVKSVLRAYDEVHVIYEYGKYHVSAGIMIKAVYGEDHKFIGTYKASEIYTEIERIENYINSFKEYPINYKGKRDYRLLKEMEDGRVVDIETGTVTDPVGKIDENGNFILTGTKTWKL